MINLRVLANVLKHSGFGPITCVFLFVFLACSLIVWLTDPNTLSFTDGMWLSFEVITTIGFGDIVVDGAAARSAAVILSIFSIFYIALVTGVVVSYCTSAIKVRQEGTLANFMDKLERLDKMTPEELTEFSKAIRKYRGTK